METFQPAEALHPDPRDRRGEHRYRAEGSVRLLTADPDRFEFVGELVDYSRSGFRAIHQYSALSAGQSVLFEHLLAAGEARVAWNRIVAGQTETGFITVTPPARP